jgi:hypothetical protein
MDGRLWNPRLRWQEKVLVLVFLETDTGHLGVGEAWNSAASPQALVATIEEDLAPWWAGGPLLRRARVAAGLPAHRDLVAGPS